MRVLLILMCIIEWCNRFNGNYSNGDFIHYLWDKQERGWMLDSNSWKLELSAWNGLIFSFFGKEFAFGGVRMGQPHQSHYGTDLGPRGKGVSTGDILWWSANVKTSRTSRSRNPLPAQQQTSQLIHNRGRNRFTQGNDKPSVLGANRGLESHERLHDESARETDLPNWVAL